MSELDDQQDKPGGTPDPPADTDNNRRPSALDKLLCAVAMPTFMVAASLKTIDNSPEQPSFPKDPPQAIAAPAQKDRGSVIPAEDDGRDRREEAEEMTEGLTKGDKGRPT